MKQRPKAKASKNSAARTTRNRRRRRNPIQVNVRPVALQAGDSGEAIIPAVVKSTPDSTDAIISVEVKRGRLTRRRAAVIPIAVKKRASASEDQCREKEENSAHDKNRWSDPITDSVISITNVAQGLVRLAHDVGFVAVSSAELWSRAIFSRATVVASAAEQGKLGKVDMDTVVRNPRLAEIRLHAA